jgi:hypothetical protein
MADEQRPSGPPGGKRRRPPTTLDLKATEIRPDSVQPTETTDPPQQATPTDAPLAEPSASSEANVEAPREAQAPSPNAQTDVGGGRPERPNRRLVAASVAGAMAALVLLLALWSFGAFGTRDDQEARLAALEKQVRDLAAKPAAAGADPRALTDLDARVAKVEQAAAAPRSTPPDPALVSRIAALEAAVRDAKARADTALETAQKNSAQPAAQAEHKEIEGLAARIAALEQAAKSVDEKIARATRSAEADRAGRLAFVAAALRSAAERGEPYAQELAAAKSLVADASALAPLEPFATTGVPRAPMLARELSQISGPILSAAGSAPREGGIFDRLQQNAERLVRIRPISEAPGEDAGAIVTRAEAKASHSDIAGALSELSRLPDAVRAPAQAWIKKAEAQIAALAAARKLADNAVGALKGSP